MHKRLSLSHLIAMLFAALLLFCMGNAQDSPVYGQTGKQFVLSNSPPEAAQIVLSNETTPIPVEWIAFSMPGVANNRSAMDNNIVNPADVQSTALFSLSNYSYNYLRYQDARPGIVNHYFRLARDGLRER